MAHSCPECGAVCYCDWEDHFVVAFDEECTHKCEDLGDDDDDE